MVPGVHLGLVFPALGVKFLVGFVADLGIVPAYPLLTLRELFQKPAGHPAVGEGAAPEAFQNAHMDVLFPGDFPGRVVGHSRNSGGGFGRKHLPAALGLFRLLWGGDLRRLIEVKPWVVAGGNGEIAVFGIDQRQLHVALSACQPDISNKDIGKDLFPFSAAQGQGIGTSRRQGREPKLPMPLVIGVGAGDGAIAPAISRAA